MPTPHENKDPNPGSPPRSPGRIAAMEILLRWLRDGDFPDRHLSQVRHDRPFVTEVVLGCVRQYGVLRWALETRARRIPDPEVLAPFLVGAYELLFLDQSQPHAAVCETVEGAKSAIHPSAAAFLNALLRRIAAEKSAILDALPRQPDPVRLSHPNFLLRRWSAAFGETRMRKLCDWNNGRPDRCLHPFRLRNDLPSYQQTLDRAGVRARPHPFAPDDFLVLDPGSPAVEDLPGYAEGAFTIQDPATSLSVRLLQPKPGERILDACASPGGKTVLMAEALNGSGELIAMELHEDRMERLRDTLRRLNLRGVRPVRADAARLTPETLSSHRLAPGGFDAILLDVPCSNTGVIRRRPDVRWRVSPDLLERIRRSQEALLDAAARLVKPGGRIVYSTCSLETEENEGRVGSWVSQRTGFRMERALKSFPPDSGCDGAYAARIRNDP